MREAPPRAMRGLVLALLRLAALCACQPAACTHRQLRVAAATDPNAVFDEVDDAAKISFLQSETQLAVPALKPKAGSHLAFSSVSQRDCEDWLLLGKLMGHSRLAQRRLALFTPELRSDFCVRKLGRPPEVAPEALDCDLAGALAKGERLVYFIRHAEGWHNLLQDFSLKDPSLTPHGEQQARDLVKHPGLARAVSGNSSQRAQLVMVSPLSRTLATAILGLNASLPPDRVPWHVDPDIAEASNLPCDTPLQEHGVEALRKLRRLDLMSEYRMVPTACFEKTGRYQFTTEAVRARFRGFTARLLQREARRVVVVAHAELLRLVLSNGIGTGPIFGLAEVRPYALSQEGSYRPLACGG